jgi:thiol-disulfide isomerase/thioredoxin
MPRKSTVLLALAVALVSAACTSGGSDAAHKPVPATNATTAPLLPTDAQALPDFTTDQYHQLLGQLKGTPVVVNLWGSWCGPCRQEASLLKKASDTYGKQIQFLGIDILDAKPSAQKYMDEFGLTFPSVFDPSGGGDIRNQLGYIGQPDTLFYDASGKLVSDHEGQITQQELADGIAKILPGSSASPLTSHDPFAPTPSP